jgi:hypothetical protein
MAQTKNKKKQPPAIERYNRLTLVKQRLTWLYYRGITTHNQEGLSETGVVGGKDDWVIAGTVKQYIPADKFNYQAKVRHYACFITNLFVFVCLFLIPLTFLFLFLYCNLLASLSSCFRFASRRSSDTRTTSS